MMKYIITILFIQSFNTFANFSKLSKEERELRTNSFLNKANHLINEYRRGDVVGNGMDKYEQMGAMSLKQLDNLLNMALVQEHSPLSSIEQAIVKDIISINKKGLLHYVNKRSDIFYKNSKTNLFLTGHLESSPILVNVYELKKATFKVSDFTMALIHEFGHQVGVASHSSLDELSTIIMSIVNSNTEVLSGREIKLSLINGEIIHLVKSNKVTSLDPLIKSKLNCPKGQDLHSYKLSNPHWKERNEKSKKVIIWADTYCQDNSMAIWTHESDIELDLEVL